MDKKSNWRHVRMHAEENEKQLMDINQRNGMSKQYLSIESMSCLLFVNI